LDDLKYVEGGPVSRRWDNYYFRSAESVITIQGHPNSWSEHRLREFEMIVDYLQEIGVPIIKPSSLI